jgi:hypothetical protein
MYLLACLLLTTQSSSPRSTHSFMRDGVRMATLSSAAAAQKHTHLSCRPHSKTVRLVEPDADC